MPKIMLKTFKDIEIKVNSNYNRRCSYQCDHHQENKETGEYYCDITRSVIVDGKRCQKCMEEYHE